MKLILNAWRDYLVEGEQKIYSFDFDSTLIRYRSDPDDPPNVVYDGPHEENIQLAKQLAAQGNKIIIVTSRMEPQGPKKWWDDSPLPEDIISDHELPIEAVYYTNGNLKADKLLELGVSKHWDDDEEEIAAAEEAGIEAVLVPSEEGLTEALRNKWINHLAAEAKQN
tara:strand:- start:844 stop:1344 length:501 start_codon:yes stop_codon:yes gene_type:complete